MEDKPTFKFTFVSVYFFFRFLVFTHTCACSCFLWLVSVRKLLVRRVDHLRSEVWDQPGQHGDTPSLYILKEKRKKKIKKSKILLEQMEAWELLLSKQPPVEHVAASWFWLPPSDLLLVPLILYSLSYINPPQDALHQTPLVYQFWLFHMLGIKTNST